MSPKTHWVVYSIGDGDDEGTEVLARDPEEAAERAVRQWEQGDPLRRDFMDVRVTQGSPYGSIDKRFRVYKEMVVSFRAQELVEAA